MTETNDYTNQASFQLYDTSGSVEDWSYWQTGGLGFTFEIGPDSFHPAYETGVVAEYLGLEPAAGAGQGGNREAYYRMAEATLDAGRKKLQSQIEREEMEAEAEKARESRRMEAETRRKEHELRLLAMQIALDLDRHNLLQRFAHGFR